MARQRASDVPLAHSPPQPGAEGDPYARHVEAVRRDASQNAEAMLRYASDPPPGFLQAIEEAATFHDLGKLDHDIQAVLRKGRGGRLRWDHIDAGVAHLSAVQDWMAAWLIRSHHAPGLPEKQAHFNRDKLGWRLRGRRRDEEDHDRHQEQIERTDTYLQHYLNLHESVIGQAGVERRRPVHGLTMRLALSCLVDADHSDTAFFDSGRHLPEAPEPRWAERLDVLGRYVRGLPCGNTDAERARNRRRAAFFDACLNARIEGPLIACEGPVGLGKTTAVAAYLIRRARDEGLRRLIIVAPYTNILTQTAGVLRKALILPGETPDSVVVEHHHRADFENQTTGTSQCFGEHRSYSQPLSASSRRSLLVTRQHCGSSMRYRVAQFFLTRPTLRYPQSSGPKTGGGCKSWPSNGGVGSFSPAGPWYGFGRIVTSSASR